MIPSFFHSDIQHIYVYIYINIQHEPFEPLDWIHFLPSLGPRVPPVAEGTQWEGLELWMRNPFFSPWMNQSRSYSLVIFFVR